MDIKQKISIFFHQNEDAKIIGTHFDKSTSNNKKKVYVGEDIFKIMNVIHEYLEKNKNQPEFKLKIILKELYNYVSSEYERLKEKHKELMEKIEKEKLEQEEKALRDYNEKNEQYNKLMKNYSNLFNLLEISKTNGNNAEDKVVTPKITNNKKRPIGEFIQNFFQNPALVHIEKKSKAEKVVFK